MKHSTFFIRLQVYRLLAVCFLVSGLMGTAQAKGGAYVEAGPLGMFHLGGSERKLDAGPGVSGIIGYDWSILGVQMEVFYAGMGQEAGQLICEECHYAQPFWLQGYRTTGDETANFIGGTVDLKIRPLGGTESRFQPFGLVGVGGQFLDSGIPIQDDATGIGAKLGVGIDVQLTEHLLIDVGGAFRPMFFDTEGAYEGSFDQYFVSLHGGLKVRF